MDRIHRIPRRARAPGRDGLAIIKGTPGRPSSRPNAAAAKENPNDPRLPYLEAAILSVSGGVAGVVLGSAAAFGVQGILNFPARVTPTVLLAGLGLSAAVGLVAGYWPARRAAALVVVDALRDEA